MPRTPRRPAIEIGSDARWDILSRELEREIPWLARAIGALRGPYWRPGINTAAVSEDGRVYVDPDVLSWPDDAVKALFEHEVWHPVLEHARRAAAEGARQHAWNIGADCEIHSGHLRPRSLAALSRAVSTQLDGDLFTPARIGAAEGLTAEEYYRAVSALFSPPGGMPVFGSDGAESTSSSSSSATPPARSKGRSGGSKGKGPPGGEKSAEEPGGSGADGVRRSYEAPRAGDPVQQDGSPLPSWTPAEIESIRRAVAESIREAAHRGCGDLPGGLVRWADSVLKPPVVDWRALLRRRIQGGIQAAGRVDYSWRNLSRRDPAGKRGYLSPGMVTPQPEVAVVVDTSGSMGTDELTEAVSEVVGIVRAIGGGCRVAACDTVASRFLRVRRASEIMLVGGGGTYMGAGIEAAGRLRPRPAVIVVLTDGYTPWPDAPVTAARTIAVLVGAGSATDPPAWITTVRVERREES